MRWVGSFLLGVFLWYVLTFILGFVVRITGLVEYYNPELSNLYNFVLFPMGLWLGFKITKTRFFGSSKKDLDKKRKEKVFELKGNKEQLELLKKGLKTGKAKRVYKVLIRDLVGIKEDFWELSEEQVKKWVDEEGVAYVNLHQEGGQPQYTFVSKRLWEKWDKAEEIMLNPNLSSEKKAKALEKLVE